MASLLRTDSPGDLERSQVPIRTSFATMMRETSECRHRPREFVRSTHEESVKDVSVDLSGMSPRVHTLSPLRGARDLALRPSPRLGGICFVVSVPVVSVVSVGAGVAVSDGGVCSSSGGGGAVFFGASVSSSKRYPHRRMRARIMRWRARSRLFGAPGFISRGFGRQPASSAACDGVNADAETWKS